MRFRLIRVCKGEAMSAIPQDVVRFDLEASIGPLREAGYEVEDREMMLLARHDGVEVTIYINGRLMISPMADKEMAKTVSDRIYSILKVEQDS
ncbi:MAG: hypothetical protein WC375_02265 [Methanomassiliicoccales archaeon]|jgi:hypothetical protein